MGAPPYWVCFQCSSGLTMDALNLRHQNVIAIELKLIFFVKYISYQHLVGLNNNAVYIFNFQW